MTSPIRVLHVDDDAAFLDLAATCLERESDRIVVETATSASDGLDRLGDGGIDCLVSDYDMPGRTGIEFLELVREDHPELPFILFTGKGSEEVARDAIAAGVTDYLQKERSTSQYAVLAHRIENAVSSCRTREQLAAERNQYQRLFDQAPVMYAVTSTRDDELVIETCNQAFLDRLGYERDAVIGEPISAFYTTRSREEFLDDGYARVLAGEFTTAERDLVAADGDVIETLLRAVPRIDANGDTVGTLTLYIDVTEQNEQERELRRKERRYQAIFEAPNILTALLDTDGRLREPNRTALEYVDADVTDVLDEPFWETPWWDEETKPLIREAVERAANGEYTEYEAELQTADGEPYSVAGVIRPVLSDSGDVASMIVSARDITERKDRERELEATRDRLELALKSSNLGVYDWDVPTETLTVDDQVPELLGFSPDEFDTDLSDWIERIHPSDHSDVRDDIDALFGDEIEFSQSEYRMRAADGDWTWIQTLGTVVEWTDAGEPKRILGVHRNVTDRKERERALKRERDRLDEFASIVSHDLRNPLNIAAGRLELASEACDSEHLDQIDVALDRMKRIIDDVLWLSRNGRDVGSLEAVDLRAVIDAAWSVVVDETDAAELVYTAGSETDLGSIRADYDQLRHLLENLFRNAVEHGSTGSQHGPRADDAVEHGSTSSDSHVRQDAVEHGSKDSQRGLRADDAVEHGSTGPDSRTRQDASENGGPDVTVRVEATDDGFAIEDDGPGIPPGEREQVFDLGYTTAADGTGIGLMIIEQVATGHGWDVTVGDSPTGGARFEITGVDYQ